MSAPDSPTPTSTTTSPKEPVPKKPPQSSSAPSSPLRSNRSSTRGKDAPSSPGPGGSQHGRKGSNAGGGGKGRRGSQGAQGGQRMESGGASTPPPQTASASPSAQSSPRKGGGHRKNASGNTPTLAATPNANNASSTLNPNAGGFHPHSLGSISDMVDEGLVTPTATSFDLMTGMPRNVLPVNNIAGIGGFRSPPPSHSAQFGAGAAGGGQFPEELPGFGGVTGLNQRGFSFPAQPQAAAALAVQQQQQFMLQQQMAAQMGNFQQTPSATAEGLMAEQLAIQQQLENLQAQQASLMARFGDMQINEASQQGQQQQSQQQGQQQSSGGGGGSSGGHRRVQSQQQQVGGGVMGSFGQGGLGSFGGQGGLSGFTGQQSNLPKGHGRRHSVNTVSSGSNNTGNGNGNTNSNNKQGSFGSPQIGSNGAFGGSPNITQSPAMGGFGSFGGGFQFPNNGQQRQQQPQAQQLQGEAEFSAGAGVNTGFRHHRAQSSTASLNGWMNNPNGSANLAEAQSHLQQLATYRASAGHSRLPSFGMSMGAGPGQLAMAGYGGNLPQQNAGNAAQMRKSLFAPYLPQASIPPLLAAGKLVIGVLRVNKRNRSDAYVATDVLDADIYICGSKDRNRALEGDVVAVELLDVDEVWGTKKEKEEKKRKKEESTSYDPRATRDIRKQDKKKDDVEVEGQGLMLFEEEEVNDDQKPQFAGHVVAVVERAPGQLFSGMLGVLRPSSAATQQKQDAERREREGADLRSSNNSNQPPPKIIWFRPTDKRVPLIAIPTDQAPADFVEKADKYADRLFVACIKRWPITSLHPFGTLVEELGTIGDIETETSALLKDCNFSAEDFSESVIKCLPPIPWSIPERETNPEVRRDFRDKRVFTIDPETAKDLDDALHIIKNEDGTFEVGVHIADVTHFVKPNTALDREARKRATTVYLVQRAVPMLPPTLCEALCSLTPHQDKLTFSVVFTLTPDGKIISTWFGKSIINSVSKLAYSDAQEVIDGNSLPERTSESSEVREGIESDVKLMDTLARQIRARRFENGSLRIDNVKVSINLDEDGLPQDCSQFVRKEANELIEEFMLMANMAVAGKIAAGLPDQSLLRRHEPPIDRRLNAFVERIGRLGIDLDGSSAGTLMKSFQKVTDPAARTTLQHLSTKGMMRAKYFCTGMLDIAKYHHYALNVPLYTHFTSPIRRYADIMVHRQLEGVLQGAAEAKFTLDTEAVSKVAQTCNIKKDAARLAQEQSAHLFLCHLISDLTARYGPVVRPATVIGVLDEAFDVLVPEFGIEKRVHINDLPIENAVYEEHTNSLALYWKKGENVLNWLAETQNDAHLLRVRQQGVDAQSASARAASESALSGNDDKEVGASAKAKSNPSKTSSQHQKSQDKSALVFEEVNITAAGHRVQTVKELQTVHVIVTADISKSPPILRLHSINPFEKEA